MSRNYYSMTCIGLKVPKEKIISGEIELRNLCSCVPQTTPNYYPDTKYCPDCGRPIKKRTKVDKPLFDGFDGDWYNEEVKIKGWKVEHDGEARNFYICIFTTGHVEFEEKSDIPDLYSDADEAIDRFKADMKSVGLWDKDQFGLWTVTFCSY